ncbi:hypothetical protein CMT48_10400 [Elizabethkingia anophelis]|nr:hypothetical protein A2T74_06670 [Elizabethkingia anophelis]AMX47700.1 hypothetical protein A4C56_06670 [Elizabethkingia anophelis]AMX51157.1 hypothetical protein A2T72_06670 [Elizabethkingia anophelis]AMX54552.1 hypothetical protein A2T59_06670 [Elizabethkingia anophelis]EGT4346316.1 hypothetical protein [Elizabethkingia anophelis]
MKKFSNNKSILLFMASIFLLLFISKATKLIVYGFQFNAEESNAYNIGLFTGKILTLIYFSILSYSFYKKYLYLKKYKIK